MAGLIRGPWQLGRQTIHPALQRSAAATVTTSATRTSYAKHRYVGACGGLDSQNRHRSTPSYQQQQQQQQLRFQHSEALIGSPDYRLLRLAEREEVHVEQWMQNYTRLGMSISTVNSKVPLSADLFHSALKHTANKVPCLRLAIKEVFGKLWVAEVDNMDIDFKMIKHRKIDKVLEHIKDEGVNNYPWSVWVMPAQKDEPCPIPEMGEAFPHQYNLILKQNVFMDGYSMARTLRCIVECLEDLVTGKPIDDRSPIGRYSRGDELLGRKVDIKKALKNDPDRLEREKEWLMSTFKSPLLYEAFPMPSNVENVTTKHIVKKVETDLLNAFHSKCKSIGVSISSGLLEVFNAATVEMVQDAGVRQEGYQLVVGHYVNMRRYLLANPKDVLGSFIGKMHQSMHCSANTRKDFWENAKDIHENFHALIKQDGPTMEECVRDMVFPPIDPDEFVQTTPTKDERDYAFSNLMDLTPTLFNNGKYVQHTNIVAVNYNHNYTHPILYEFQTYHGFSHLTGNYDTSKLTDDTANELMDRIMGVLRSVSS
ncbi:unnamed protein product [Meganyctiphanes norvegica]|uniref:Uncharacterized protein n=1 Tax=Meganyctiphanes norvegica TaxID=48144 RepID=A0AAV2Q1C5_MEGNR